jgi:lipase chaperone LimK
MADLLFSRDEAMERYEVDRLGLEADPSLSVEQKAQRLRERREALKVELAAQGTFVSFPDETAAAGITDGAGEGRPQ